MKKALYIFLAMTFILSSCGKNLENSVQITSSVSTTSTTETTSVELSTTMSDVTSLESVSISSTTEPTMEETEEVEESTEETRVESGETTETEESTEETKESSTSKGDKETTSVSTSTVKETASSTTKEPSKETQTTKAPSSTEVPTTTEATTDAPTTTAAREYTAAEQTKIKYMNVSGASDIESILQADETAKATIHRHVHGIYAPSGTPGWEITQDDYNYEWNQAIGYLTSIYPGSTFERSSESEFNQYESNRGASSVYARYNAANYYDSQNSMSYLALIKTGMSGCHQEEKLAGKALKMYLNFWYGGNGQYGITICVWDPSVPEIPEIPEIPELDF